MTLADIIIIFILLISISLIIVNIRRNIKVNKCYACPYAKNCSKRK